jgi:hypothetical protein
VERTAARVRGGLHKRTSIRAAKLTPQTLRPVLDQLHDAMDAVANGSMPPKTGAALAALAGAVVRVYEASVLEQRLAALEGASDVRYGANRRPS